MDVPVEVLRSGREAIDRYIRALPYGENWAAMVATQIAPGTKGSDRAFMEGRLNNQQLDEMPTRQAKFISQQARDAGISISGKYYCGGIADHRGWRDPEAWVSSNDDIRRVAMKRGHTVAGSVNYDAGPPPPVKRKALSERIIKEEIAREKRLNPGLKVTPELRHKIIERHAHPKLRGK
jgi:hypothetical protein